MSPTTSGGVERRRRHCPRSSVSSTTTARPGAAQGPHGVGADVAGSAGHEGRSQSRPGTVTVRPMIAAVVVTHAAPRGTLAACVDSIAARGGVDRDDRRRQRRADADGEPATTSSSIRVVNHGLRRGRQRGLPAGVRRWRRQRSRCSTTTSSCDAGWSEPLRSRARRSGGRCRPAQAVDRRQQPAARQQPRRRDRSRRRRHRHRRRHARRRGRRASEIARFTGGAVMFAPDVPARHRRVRRALVPLLRGRRSRRPRRRPRLAYRLVPASVVEHERSTTTAADGERTRYLQERNRLWHAFRHCEAGTQAGAVWLSLRRLRHQPRAVHAKALAAGLAGVPRAWLRRVRTRELNRPVALGLDPACPSSLGAGFVSTPAPRRQRLGIVAVGDRARRRRRRTRRPPAPSRLAYAEPLGEQGDEDLRLLVAVAGQLRAAGRTARRPVAASAHNCSDWPW